MNIKKIEFNTNLIPLFSGTYETCWEVSELADNGEELEVEYKHSDLMKSIIEVYKHNENWIVSELGLSFIKKIEFSDTYFSPREYNFKTDQLDFTATIDWDQFLTEVDKLKDNQEFEKYLKDNFTSRDGFLSFTPNNYQELADNIKNEGSEFDQAISAVIGFLTKQYAKSTGRSITIEQDVYEDWRANGYYGLDYQVVKEA